MIICITHMTLAAAGNIIVSPTLHLKLERHELNHQLFQENWIDTTRQKEDHPSLEMSQAEQIETSDIILTGLSLTSEGQTITRTLTVLSKFCEKNKIIDS